MLRFVESHERNTQANVIFWSLMLEHIVAYLFIYIKKDMIFKNGVPDSYGVLISSSERTINTVGMIGAAIILGWSLNFLFFLEEKSRL